MLWSSLGDEPKSILSDSVEMTKADGKAWKNYDVGSRRIGMMQPFSMKTWRHDERGGGIK